MIKKKTAKTEDLRKLYDGSALTLEGVNVSTDEYVNDIFEFLVDIGACSADDDIEMFVIKGKMMNTEYHLTGTNAYKARLTIIGFDLSQFTNPSNWCLKTRQVGFRWFNDVVDNNARREGYHPYSDDFDE